MRNDCLKGNNQERLIQERPKKEATTCTSCVTIQGEGDALSSSFMSWRFCELDICSPCLRGFGGRKEGLVAADVKEEPAEWSVPLGGKETDVVGKNKPGMGTRRVPGWNLEVA